MDNISKIVKYFKNGENPGKRLGVELEYFVCDRNGNLIDYSDLSSIMNDMAEKHSWQKLYEDDNIIGLVGDKYIVTLEPAGQFEISINAFENLEDIEAVYRDFRQKWDPALENAGYELLERGVFPTVESGEDVPDNLKLIPKKRYDYMNRYFETTGRFGKYMMRATASTQVSVDYSSMEDCLRKIRIIEKMAPLLALLMENSSGMGRRSEWEPHLFRMQIWDEVDGDRCGYIPGSLDKGFSYEQYAGLVYRTPFILLNDKNKIIDVGSKSAEEYLEGKEIDFVEHLLTMFFYHVRLKKYIEIRIADSVSEKKMLGYVALLKGLLYFESSLCQLEELLADVRTIDDIREMELNIRKKGYNALVLGTDVTELLYRIYMIARESLSESDKKYLFHVLTLPLLEYAYRKDIDKDAGTHCKSFFRYKEYMHNSTAKYHGRAARTMYLPKLFTQNEIDFFSRNVGQLFGIFDKVIAEYERSPEFRKLFCFDETLEALILREKNYDCNIPIARIDIFYNEQTKEYKFCEFNTDGSSAMNEDRELNYGLRFTKAYESFAKEYKVESLELFDSWVSEFLDLYGQYAKAKGKNQVPNVAIVDFLEQGTVSEFEIFEGFFRKRGIDCVICDIRQLKYDGHVCVSPDGMQVDAIYRRAVTSDICKHYGEIEDFLAAVKDNALCLIGDFRTQIVHNKLLYKVLHLPEVQGLFSKAEQRFIKAHVPYTVSLTKEVMEQNPQLWENVRKNKNSWIIKPEDSYGSLGVHAGVECDEGKWLDFVEKAMDQHYILQEFCIPYRLLNVEWNSVGSGESNWSDTANLTGMFVYNGKLKGLYSRISFDEMISSQYNEMTLPTLVVKA